MARWASGEQTVQFLVDRDRPGELWSRRSVALTGALIGWVTLTDDGFLHTSFKQVEVPTHGPQTPLTLRIRW